ncbi:unnamed protein product [Soboliphyme baturini]|uniref:G_PROTEIN_RECEP_F1_2 domain-containing protein n=1 Tax=Soboliphyme baturini TaxID=241478 RepID=A0A183JB85_9BILA|nr:unnamed protein product [Soboliphyme baturini]
MLRKLAVAATVEGYIMVAFPAEAKRWCLMRNSNICIVACVLCAVALQVYYLLCRKVEAVVCSDDTFYYLLAIGDQAYEMSYYWAQSLSTLLVPMFTMITLTLMIYYLLFWARPTFQQSSEQKLCVARPSLATTACHLIFEMPHVANFMILSIDEAVVYQWRKSSTWQTFAATAN